MRATRAVLLGLIMGSISSIASAVPILITAKGTIYEWDYSPVFAAGDLTGATVEATWSFETDDRGQDILGTPNEARYIGLGLQWILGTVTITSTTPTWTFGDLSDPRDDDDDLITIRDEFADFDVLVVISSMENVLTPATFWSSLHVSSPENLFDSVNLAQDASLLFSNNHTSFFGEQKTTYADGSYFNFSYNFNSVTIDDLSTSSPVPEPESLVLFGLGLIGLAAVRRRREM